ncbi:ARM repeat-containing protein [Irpex rosettiformis]|uniref:ARM repeat-containing protein n=1 Tax=Irpex rosettiformis TaxID=378272 RepID=A0ACB8UKV0_9APHY|nr:ARM repeat-containing protein [Irpex rosettiformis]
MAARSEEDKELFRKLKELCVPLLSNAVLTPASTTEVSALLTKTLNILRDAKSNGRILKPALISYVFFPISSILRRNSGSTIPDQLLEKLLSILTILCDDWWWNMDIQIWEQIVMLCGAIIGGIENKGKGKDRADETKEVAAQCLWTLLRLRLPSEDPLGIQSSAIRSVTIFNTFQAHSRTAKFVPIVGQIVDSLLGTCQSQHLPLVRASMKLLQVIVSDYLADDVVTSVFPGVVSSMCKVALAVGNTKAWANGDIVAAALGLFQQIIVRSIGDEICVKEGAVVAIDSLEDLVELETQTTEDPKPGYTAPYTTRRTKSWLRGSSSQLHMALISLKPLVTHPTSSALLALSSFSAAILEATPLTLPQSQPLLLSWLLSLTHSDYAKVSSHAKKYLLSLLDPASTSQHTLTQVLLQISKEHLTALPRLLPSHSDTKIEHSAKIVEAICSLASDADDDADRRPHVVSHEIGRLLGPNGSIERWGWSLLSVLTLTPPQILNTSVSASQLMLEGDGEAVQSIPFPEVTLQPLTSRSAQDALERMFRAMGLAAGEDGLYAVEWFLDIGKNRQDSRGIAGLWCACRLLEGIGNVSLNSSTLDTPLKQRRRRLEKFVRGLAKALSEIWDESEPSLDEPLEPPSSSDQALLDGREDIVVEHTKGLITIRSPLDMGRPTPPIIDAPLPSVPSPFLRKALALQNIAACAGILQARFTPLLLNVLYPILHSLVSGSNHLSSTALATLHYITHFTSYASPTNLLLSNFDYALDSVSRRLSRRWLDIDAPKVLVILIRLVGRDVVQKAGDVVEECFDRLDEFHGYELLVDGLIAVLLEVVVVVGSDEQNHAEPKRAELSSHTRQLDDDRFDSFFEWFGHRHDKQPDDGDHRFQFSEVPQTDWGAKEEDGDRHAGRAENPTQEVPPTPTQSLTKQIVSRSLYFLTHGSPVIRARILNVLGSSVPVLPESALLPSIHQAWPFILNRMGDSEPFVVAASVSLIEVLSNRVGDFMHQRIWDDVWPRFQTLLQKLEGADSASALARRGPSVVGTESAYTVSHRLYKAMIGTMKAAANGVQPKDVKTWEVILAFRRFLHKEAHEELQKHARELYHALVLNNPDAVWFALAATQGEIETWTFLRNPYWSIQENARQILQAV